MGDKNCLKWPIPSKEIDALTWGSDIIEHGSCINTGCPKIGPVGIGVDLKIMIIGIGIFQNTTMHNEAKSPSRVHFWNLCIFYDFKPIFWLFYAWGH